LAKTIERKSQNLYQVNPSTLELLWKNLLYATAS